MDEKRRQAYLELTQELLSADGSRVSEILDAKREWVDAGWVDMLEQVATHLIELGIVHLDRQKGVKANNLERAIHYLQNTLHVYTRTEFPEPWAEAQKLLGVVYWKRLEGERSDNLERSIACYQNALQIYTQAEFPGAWAETQNALAMAYRARIQGERHQNLQRAIDCCQAALGVRTQVAFPDAYAETMLNLGLLYWDTGQLKSAYNTFAAAIETVESLRGEILSGDVAKQKLAAEWHQLYTNVVGVSLELAVDNRDYLEKAIAYMERSKTRTLVELILNRDLNHIVPSEIASQLQHLQDAIHQGQHRIQTGTAENITTLAQQLQQLRQQRNELQNRYLPIGSGFELAPLQATLDDHTAVLEWYIANDRMLAFILTPNSCQPSNTTCQAEKALLYVHGSRGCLAVWQSNLEDLKALVDWLQTYLGDYYRKRNAWKAQLTQQLERLAKILHLDWLVTQLPENCNQLILIPHRFLHPLPLHALPISTGTLLDRFSGGVRYAPSCQLLQLAKNRQRPDFTQLFAIQNPTSDLVYADIEVEAIHSHFETFTTCQGAVATKTALKHNFLSTIHCVHFACHGFSDLISPLDSALQLADAPLTLEEIFSLNLHQTRLVTLSACETGLTDPTSPSDEYIGLPSGFLCAGSASVVSSLWSVDDLSTTFLMVQFYQLLREGNSIAIALNQAQCWLRDATKVELESWMQEQPFYQKPTIRMRLRQRLHKMPNNTRPFGEPFHWAAFCAIGQP